MKNQPRKTLILFIATILAALMVIIGWLFLSEIIATEGPVWRGITIGLSTKEEALKVLGQPSSIKKGIIATTYIYREEGVIKGTHYVVVRYGVVQEVEEDTLVYPDYIKLQSMIDKYGLPLMVEWSLEGPGRRTVIFKNGVLANVVASPLDDAVITKIIYHRPMPTILLQLKYMRIFSSMDPFPKSDIVGKKDPWFGTSNSCRGGCQ